MRKIKILAIILCSLILSFSFAQPTEKDISNGEKTRKYIDQQIGTYDHGVVDYLHGIGQRLVSSLDNPEHDYQYAIVDMSEPNALALPNGYIYFSRGILLLATSEDELAGIMGHETIHVARYHSRKSQKKSIITGIFKIPGAIVGAFSPVAGGILMAPASLFDAGYSRQNEKQADELGVTLAAKAGYDPHGMISIFGKIAGEAIIESGEEEQRSFFSTHPYTPKRIDNVNKTIRKLDYSPTEHIVPDRKAFLEKLDGLLIGENPAKGVFYDTLFLHPELNFALSFPNGWKGMNTARSAGWTSEDDGNVQALLDISDTARSPAELAQEFVKGYAYYYGLTPVVNESMEINDNIANHLVYENYSDSILMVLDLLWMKYNESIFQFVLLGTNEYRGTIEAMAKSLHNMTLQERDLIQQTLLRIVKAEDGESLKALSDRTGNVLDLEFTALINDLNPEQELAGGQLIKIGILSNY